MKRYMSFRNKNESISFQIEKRSVFVISFLTLFLLLFFVVGTGLGDTRIAPIEVIRTIFGTGSGEYDFIVQNLRLPRAIVALLVGAALGVSGAILQGIIRNPLASPDIIGITGGASVAAVSFITYLSGAVSIKLLPLAAIAGAITASLLIYVLSWRDGVTPMRLVLIGIGISAAMSAATTLMLVMSPFFSAGQAYIWLTGSVYGASWEDVYPLLAVNLLFIPLALFYAKALNVQELGDEIATGLGATVQKHRFVLSFISVVLAGSAVSVAGAIGFVGLIAPHIARKLVGRPFGSLLLASALIGGLLVFTADLIARTAFYPLDIPAGVFTAGVGALFFLYLLFRNRHDL
ncbi:FecCD family ABC transporter permease [Bacillus fonticola]|uniref:FecCD family ABC transporter permease n=1 Tax=Bacillus fonticola TaxID=2728853 RepID=UPI001474FAA1|nr:iron ABC transporter permease [Bacillus fonticola]